MERMSPLVVVYVAAVEGACWFAVIYLLALVPFGLLFP